MSTTLAYCIVFVWNIIFIFLWPTHWTCCQNPSVRFIQSLTHSRLILLSNDSFLKARHNSVQAKSSCSRHESRWKLTHLLFSINQSMNRGFHSNLKLYFFGFVLMWDYDGTVTICRVIWVILHWIPRQLSFGSKM